VATTLAPVDDIVSEPGEIELQLRWGDMDTNRHVNNVQIARLFEEARVRAVAGWIEDQDFKAGAFHLARQEIEFVAPLLYTRKPVTASVWISRLGTSSFDFGSALRDGDGALVGLCETTGVMVDLERGGTRPVPEEVRILLKSKMADPVPFRRRA
jgi:acyl-CoA thioester hydrolase